MESYRGFRVHEGYRQQFVLQMRIQFSRGDVDARQAVLAFAAPAFPIAL